MDTKELSEKLGSLFHLDVDAVHSYNNALDNIDIPAVKQKLIEFRDDHQRHTIDLSSKITSLGEKAPEYSRDLKGIFMESMTALQGMIGTEGAIKALRTGEKITNNRYSNAIQWDVPPDIKMLINDNYSDEKRHLTYIEQLIDSKVWETTEAGKRY